MAQRPPRPSAFGGASPARLRDMDPLTALHSDVVDRLFDDVLHVRPPEPAAQQRAHRIGVEAGADGGTSAAPQRQADGGGVDPGAQPMQASGQDGVGLAERQQGWRDGGPGRPRRRRPARAAGPGCGRAH